MLESIIATLAGCLGNSADGDTAMVRAVFFLLLEHSVYHLYSQCKCPCCIRFMFCLKTHECPANFSSYARNMHRGESLTCNDTHYAACDTYSQHWKVQQVLAGWHGKRRLSLLHSSNEHYLRACRAPARLPYLKIITCMCAVHVAHYQMLQVKDTYTPLSGCGVYLDGRSGTARVKSWMIPA